MKKAALILIVSANFLSLALAVPLTTLAPMLSKITPSVVNIAVEKVVPDIPNPLSNNPSIHPRVKKFLGVGSGVIVDAKHGLIVTNAHVVSDQKMMIVTLKNGRRYHAKLIGKDNGFDIAVIKINAKHLTQMQFADSNNLRVGDFVVAVGSPFGLTQTVTSGVISALNRSHPRIEGFQNFIQTDAPINPGNSGGALINMQGQLIGMNTAIYSPSRGNIGIGFAIPSDMVKNVELQLIKYGKVTSGMLGVLGQNINPELSDALNLPSNQGVIITEVVPASPAAKAGIKARDIILSVDGEKVNKAAQLHNMMGVLRPGTKVQIKIIRNHKPKTITASLGDPKKMLAQHEVPYLGGVRVTHFSDLEPNGTTIIGALVGSVSDTSEAALAGLMPGDIIVRANGKAINTVNQLVKIANHSSKRLLLKISRGLHNEMLYLVIEKNQ